LFGGSSIVFCDSSNKKIPIFIYSADEEIVFNKKDKSFFIGELL
jgi:hypothetical protein